MIIDFLSAYWPILLVAFIDVVSIIVSAFLLRRKSISNDAIKNLINEKVLVYVKLAEASGCCGQVKLMFVITSVLKIIKKFIKSSDEDFWSSYISEQVEAVLSTPQKKGE